MSAKDVAFAREREKFQQRINQINVSVVKRDIEIKELTEKPFDTTIDLRKLDLAKDDATEALSKWFDEHIANKVGETIYVLLKFTNYDKVLMFPLLKYVERIRKLFTEGPLFSIEEESSGINSGDDAPLYWNVVDTIAFTKIEKNLLTAATTAPTGLRGPVERVCRTCWC
jgi:hypothetical protein